MTSKLYVGIDPGSDGALVVLNEKFGIEEALCLPDEDTLRKIAKHLKGSLVTLEYPSASKEWGASAAMTFGEGIGLLRGIFEGCHLVHPRTWQAALWMKGSARKGAKEKSLEIAKLIWPHVDWRKSPSCRVAHDGLVDAALVAYYGLKNFDKTRG